MKATFDITVGAAPRVALFTNNDHHRSQAEGLPKACRRLAEGLPKACRRLAEA
jgi:hypothetical protein